MARIYDREHRQRQADIRQTGRDVHIFVRTANAYTGRARIGKEGRGWVTIEELIKVMN